MKDDNERFPHIEIYTGTEQIPSQVSEQALVQQTQAVTGLSVEQSRAIADRQAAMVVARLNPRDENAAYLKIMKACQRKSLADSATYEYPRGDKSVTGPTIRLAEVLARYWGNLDYGFKELSRDSDSSQVQAYCWDLETNVRAIREFTVKHWRDKKSGGVALTQERDKYEHIASQAQRRVRSCIFEIIPGDILEAAKEACDQTIAKGDGRPIADRIRTMITKFDALGITKAELEGLLKHPIGDTLDPAELVRLTKVYNALKEGRPKEEFFKPGAMYKREVVKEPPEAPETQPGPGDSEKPGPDHDKPAENPKKPSSKKKEKAQKQDPAQDPGTLFDKPVTRLDAAAALCEDETQRNHLSLIHDYGEEEEKKLALELYNGNEPNKWDNLENLAVTVDMRLVREAEELEQIEAKTSKN